MQHLVKNYHSAIERNFSFLKETSRLDDLYVKSIPLKNNLGFLTPICELHTANEDLIRMLASWREENAAVFPTQFKVSVEGTTAWLKSLLNTRDRILFLVTNHLGIPIGHLGLANGFNEHSELEIDNVVRGVKNLHPGIMQVALEQLIDWAEETVLPKKISLRVFSDNSYAISFYEKNGFIKNGLIPLKKHIEENSISYRPLLNSQEVADKHFLRMEYRSKPINEVSELISTAGPSISSREISYAYNAARYGWNNLWNGYIKRFEEAFADYLEVKHAITTSSCTGALHIALAALGIGPGDEVIVPDVTWVATANAVVYVGATPIFADIDPQSWCMNPQSFESLITERTKAVIPVHLYGHPAPIDTLVTIARKHRLYVIEDAAPSIGAEWKGQKTGTFGDFATFSFQGAKLAVSGEGGMLVTNNSELYQKAYTIWDQGREPNTFWIKQNGLKYKMSNIQAAIGLGQLERIEELIAAKRQIFGWYTDFLQGIMGITLNFEVKEAYSIYWMSSILLNDRLPFDRDTLITHLKKRNIDTRPVFPAISQYPHWPVSQLPKTSALHVSKNALNLPSGVCLKRNQIEYICRNIKELLHSVKQPEKEYS